jgi:hypothetical protein
VSTPPTPDPRLPTPVTEEDYIIVQRVPVFLIIALIFVALYYLTPLRDYMQSHYEPSSSTGSQQESEKDEEPFDKLSLELLVISNKVGNLEGKLRILEMAQDHPEWLSAEEYAHVSEVIAKTDKDLQEAQEEYERVKEAYARETASQIIKESLASNQEASSESETEESLPYEYLE